MQSNAKKQTTASKHYTAAAAAARYVSDYLCYNRRSDTSSISCSVARAKHFAYISTSFLSFFQAKAEREFVMPYNGHNLLNAAQQMALAQLYETMCGSSDLDTLYTYEKEERVL